MKKIALFGGTGKSGSYFIKKAINNGFSIKALARKPEKLFIYKDSIEIVEGDTTNYNNVEKTIEGTDAVVSLLGHRKDSPAEMQTISIKFIIDAMGKSGIKRLIAVTGAGVRDQKNDSPRMPDKMITFIMKNLAGKRARAALNDATKQAEYIKRSGLDWTIVRAPVLNDHPGNGSYNVGYVGKIKGFKLTREDLTDFIVKELTEEKYIQDMPFLTN